MRSFRRTIYGYYYREGRRLPWRETSDPYRIVVSEIMLQQTQVERVLGKYEAFLDMFPDFQTLARAELKEVISAWQGLGYNRRALLLQRLAKIVVERHGGMLPATMEELRDLPGVGHATAGSILAFAFNIPVVYIETNIRRVFIHYFFSEREKVNDKEIIPLATMALDRKNPREWYWALMDYGTMLKGSVKNPNRKSAHYKRQPPFKESDRMVRGRIIAMLVNASPLTDDAISGLCGIDPDRVAKILGKLEDEGFIRRHGSLVDLL